MTFGRKSMVWRFDRKHSIIGSLRVQTHFSMPKRGEKLKMSLALSEPQEWVALQSNSTPPQTCSIKSHHTQVERRKEIIIDMASKSTSGKS